MARNDDQAEIGVANERIFDTYCAFSVHHLAQRDSVSRAASELESLPGWDRVGADFLPSDSCEPWARRLADHTAGLFADWRADTVRWLSEYLSALPLRVAGSREGLPSEVAKLLELADEKLAGLIYESRARFVVGEKLKEHGNPPGRRHSEWFRGFALALSRPGSGDPLLAEIADHWGVTVEQAAAVASFHEKVAPLLDQDRDTAQEIMLLAGAEWKRLWERPGKKPLPEIAEVAMQLYGHLAVVLLTDEELYSAVKEYMRALEQAKAQIDPRSPTGTERQRALELMRSGPAELIPIRESVGAHVAEILNSYFANWRLDFDAEKVTAIFRRRRKPR